MDRESLRNAYAFRCGYCGVSEVEVGAELTIDHFQPISRGGSDDCDNLVYACFTCNNYKGDSWEPKPNHPVLHPLRDDLDLHVRLDPNGVLAGLTQAGDRHIAKLRLNRPQLVALRRERTRQAVLQRGLSEALTHHDELRRRIRELESLVAEAEQRLTNL